MRILLMTFYEWIFCMFVCVGCVVVYRCNVRVCLCLIVSTFAGGPHSWRFDRRNGWTGTRGTFGRARSASRTVRRESRVCSVTRCRRDGRGTSVWVLHVCVQPRCFAATTVEYKYAVLNAEGGARWEVRAEVRRLCGRTGGRIRSSPCFVCVAVWCVCVGVCWCVCWCV